MLWLHYIYWHTRPPLPGVFEKTFTELWRDSLCIEWYTQQLKLKPRPFLWKELCNKKENGCNLCAGECCWTINCCFGVHVCVMAGMMASVCRVDPMPPLPLGKVTKGNSFRLSDRITDCRFTVYSVQIVSRLSWREEYWQKIWMSPTHNFAINCVRA